MTPGIRDWCSRQFFTQVHTRNLVYNTCWEDPRCDRVALRIEPHHELLMLTSAGCNALDYVLDAPGHIYCVDMNPRQNALLELKISAIKNLPYEQYFQMFGEGRLESARQVYAEKLRADLKPESQQFWDRKIQYFSHKHSFYFSGTTGLFARLANRYLRFRKAREAIETLFHVESREEREKIYHDRVEQLVWTDFMRKMMGNDAALSLLGVPKPQRQQIERTYLGGVAQFTQDCLAAVFTQLPTKDNYFWSLYLFGYYTPDRCPEYLKQENFECLRERVDRISTHSMSVLDFLNGHPRPLHRFILLDHMDWLATYGKPILAAEWQAIAEHAAPDARIIWRSAGTDTDFVNSIAINIGDESRPLGELLGYQTELAQELHGIDRVHTYGSFYIADWQPA